MLKKFLLVVITVLSLFIGLVSAADKININTATVEQLETLQGIGPATATAIISYRDSHGQFTSVDELTNVKGIGDKKLETLSNDLTVSQN